MRVQMWLSYLPLEIEEDEGDDVYEQLIEYVERNNPAVLGPNMQNLPKIVAYVHFSHRSSAFPLLVSFFVVCSLCVH